MNWMPAIRLCCCENLCNPCFRTYSERACPVCRKPDADTNEGRMALLLKNVDEENPNALRQLGRFYEEGKYGGDQSYEKAAAFYRRAADLGHVLAMYNLGSMYDLGRGVRLDKKRANEYFRMAADRGLPQAQNNLGNRFRTGDGVEPDFAEALRYRKLAAHQGFKQGEHNLGIAYALGVETPRDADEAIKWLERAAAKGFALSKKALTDKGLNLRPVGLSKPSD